MFKKYVKKFVDKIERTNSVKKNTENTTTEEKPAGTRVVIRGASISVPSEAYSSMVFKNIHTGVTARISFSNKELMTTLLNHEDIRPIID